ncbi:MAG TPA: glycosyltransferase family 4 protein [Chitinophagaceae bacterium]|nr:glycosyltransferase family 4 protein [Chitinophagaceae bacterium]
MKIALVTIVFPTVSETFIANKALYLQKLGHEIIVFCSTFNKQLFSAFFKDATNITVVTFSKKQFAQYALFHPSLFLSKKKRNIAIHNARAHIINGYKPAVVHIEFSGLGILFLPVLNRLHAKKVVSCRGSAEKVKLLISGERKTNTKALFDLVDAIHCVSLDMQKTVKPYCTDTSKLFINFPSVNAKIFNRSAVYTQSTPVQILSIGRLTFQKGYFTGLQAIKLLQKKYDFTDFTWTIIGDGPQKEEIVFHIHQMALENNVVLAGPKSRDEVIAAYTSASIFFLPSVYEGIANVALEAMSMELPVVATKSGGMDEVITHNLNGMLADVYDAETLAACLFDLITNGQKSRLLGIEARKRILSEFTLEKQAGIFEDYYKKITGI